MITSLLPRTMMGSLTDSALLPGRCLREGPFAGCGFGGGHARARRYGESARLAPRHPLATALRALTTAISELRIDVALPEQDMERELQALHERWCLRPSHLDIAQGLHLPDQSLSFRMRQADGEHFIYAIDHRRNALAAYIVMNRLIELNRRADRHLRSPHTKVARAYRRMGITSAVYRWWLDSGRSLISGARQSQAAYALWLSLAQDHPTVHVSLTGKRVRVVPAPLLPQILDDIDTRMVLLGRGCAVDAFEG